MPYIKDENNRRQSLQKGEPALNAGELNYQLFYYVKYISNNPDKNIIKNFIDRFLEQGKNYQRYNDISGVLIRCCKEILRRLNIDVSDLFIEILESYDEEIANYEDLKISENGEV